jgi:hypothetical protein
VTVARTIPDKLPCVLRGGFEGTLAFYRHLSRKKSAETVDRPKIEAISSIAFWKEEVS